MAPSSSSTSSASILPKLVSQLSEDPQLPRTNPTTAFWQLPPHPLANVQSAKLPEKTEFAIIGSGVTGCSIAHTLLDGEHQPLFSSSGSTTTTTTTTAGAGAGAGTIAVFEARTLTSGATGRNGGSLTSFAPADYTLLSQAFGHEQAVKISRLANRTLDRMHELGNSSEELLEASEVRRVQKVVSFLDEECFQHAKASIQLYEQHVPEEAGLSEILSPEEALSRFNVKCSVGAIVSPSGAFWPYRLITKLWSLLYDRFKSRLAIETHTPVTAITYDETNVDYPYILTTPRGQSRASKVIHATNGYTGHLLPNLRGKIFPFRGTMSTQKAPPEFGRFGSERAWSFCHIPRLSSAGTVETGLYYSNQNPKTGDIFIGGEKVYTNEMFVSDDSTISPLSRENLSTVLPKFFEKGWEKGQGQGKEEKPEVRQIWSGIMGFTADSLPLVGKLPVGMTGRGQEAKGKEEGGEWIAAGFNGYGMPQCWSCGEAVAKMILGLDVSSFLPEVYLLTEERLSTEGRLGSPDQAVRRLFGWE